MNWRGSDLRKVGLDAEALWWGDDGSLPFTRLALCFSYGTEGSIKTVQALAPGVFDEEEMDEMIGLLSAPDVVIVGHNVMKYDLDLLQGVLRKRLPVLTAQDTMNDLKTGKAYRNTLKAQCAHYGIRLKQDSPDWRRILEADHEEWNRMIEYCENDVVCALQLEQALAADGLAVPIKRWSGRRGR